MLRSLLERHDALTKENESLREQVQRLKADSVEASNSMIEGLKGDMAIAKKQLAKADERIDALNTQLVEAAEVIQGKTQAEEQLRLRIRLLLQQFGQHVEQSIAQTPPSQPQQAQAAPALPVEAEQSVPGPPQLPCDDGAATDEYSSSSSSDETEHADGRPLPAASEL